MKNNENMEKTVGRPPKYDFYALEVGQSMLLEGKAAVYPHQYIQQYNRHPSGRKMIIVRKSDGFYAERVA